jgi:ribosomal protein S18 acetylase RimI-like enzyme
MKIQKLSEKDRDSFVYLFKNNLVNSVIFGLPEQFIKRHFFKEITNSKKYVSLICKFRKEPAGMIIIKKKNINLSITIKIITIFYSFISFFIKDTKIFFKFYFILFKKIHMNKKYYIKYNNSAEIIYICVDKKYRNKKIGSKLINFSTQNIIRGHMNLVTSSENSKEALKFYLTNGFKKIGSERRYKKNNILMIKYL